MSEKTCYHCGDQIIGKPYTLAENEFCCNGCKEVYRLLNESGLENYYNLEDNAGIKPQQVNQHKYAFLEIEKIADRYKKFQDDNSIHVDLFLPQIHCSSCIYLLENLQKIDNRILSCQVNFGKRRASIVFKRSITLSELALLLDKIGYPPNFSSQEEINKKRNNSFLYKLGVAGFAFGSVMLWSFPEYLGIEKDNPSFRVFTSYLSLGVSIPVFFYSANEFLISAYKAIRHKSVNIDVPISIGIIALYFQSVFTILSASGAGYMDSFTAFVFLLLIGKWFQNKTYDSLSFERDYKSYFPVAVTRLIEDKEEIVEIEKLEENDIIKLRNEEIIPCDVILKSSHVKIDYSFVTGESVPVEKNKGDFIYAGGKLLGNIGQFTVKNKSDRSHLTQLWSEHGRKDSGNKTDKLSLYFIIVVLLIALSTGLIWLFTDPYKITEVVVAVLIVACPCALALSKPFTYGNTLRLMGRKGLYLKNAEVIERMLTITDIVFDKTGTLTTGSTDNVEYIGDELNKKDLSAILVLTNSSTHTLSVSITRYLKRLIVSTDQELEEFIELPGEGISGIIDGHSYKLGTSTFVGTSDEFLNETNSFVSIDEVYKGRFHFQTKFRPGIFKLLNQLQKQFVVHVLSGDKSKDKETIIENVQAIQHVSFEQTPRDKLIYIKHLQSAKKHVLMIGDGLNDSGALSIANVGIAVSEDVFRFTPSSDAIIKSDKLHKLNYFVALSKRASKVLMVCYTFSFLYNLIGLSFAVTGQLTPLIAAILMPISSISIVLISTVLTLRKT